MTRYNRLALLLILGAGLLQVSPWSHGAPPSKSSETGKSDDVDLARRAVEQSLLQEMFSPVDRRRDLDATLQRHPESDLLRWQTGYVRDGDQWRPFEQAAKAVAGTDRRSRYAQRREQAPMTGAGQLALANWCREQGMHAQERAHLSAVLVLEPDLPHVEIHERLGDRLFGHQWLSPDQIQEWIALNRRSRALLAQWGPQFEKLASQLEGSRRQRDYALASLRELTDPAAIPALEYTLCGRNTEAALVAVEVFQRMDRYEATLALTKQAVFSKEPRVRAQATEALKERPLEEFAPGLIALLTTAAKAEFAVEWRLLNRSRKLGVRTTEFDSQFILFFN